MLEFFSHKVGGGGKECSFIGLDILSKFLLRLPGLRPALLQEKKKGVEIVNCQGPFWPPKALSLSSR